MKGIKVKDWRSVPWRSGDFPCLGGTPWICEVVDWCWRRRMRLRVSCDHRQRATVVRVGRSRWPGRRFHEHECYDSGWANCGSSYPPSCWRALDRRPPPRRRGRSREDRQADPGRPASCGPSPSRWPPDFQGLW